MDPLDHGHDTAWQESHPAQSVLARLAGAPEADRDWMSELRAGRADETDPPGGNP